MAGESILVVDDSAVNLRLAAAVLRSEGYRIQLASNSEQAIMMMRTALPDLLLVDIQLPGISGLELTRRLRQDPRTKDLLIVVITASVMSGTEQQAYEAGCDGFIAKPIDTRVLGSRLRFFLDGQLSSSEGAPQGDGLPAGLSLAGPEMEGLRRSFLSEGSRQVRRMAEFASSRFDIGEATRLFHQWIGSAGALGYSEIAQKARDAEVVLTSPGWTVADLRTCLAALGLAFASPREAIDTPIPESIVQGLTRRRVALIGFADEEAERVCGAFERAHALPRMFTGEEPPHVDSIQDCSVLMVHVRPETLGIPWLQSDFSGSQQPLVLVGGREDILSLPAEVQARACEFLIDGWQPEEVIMRLSFALSRTVRNQAAGAFPQAGAGGAARARRPGREKPEIIIADDDVHVRAVVRSALQSIGMECHLAANGTEAISMIRELRPDIAVLDVNMPGSDGFEVLSAIRQSGIPVKVIMLTAHQHERDVLRGFELGADDYVVKPFNPLELAARIKRLL
ncbi:MAG: response regulator [Candidatus Solibacter sp.]